MTVISLSAGFYIIANSISDFYKYNVVTQTKRTRPKSQLLPSVSFCANTNDIDHNADKTYRKANFVAQCKNRKAIAKYNRTTPSYYSTSGFI